MEDGEQDTTRCLCGQTQYPGPPPDARAAARLLGSKATNKDDNSQTNDVGSSDNQSDDAGDFFIQCDKCQVWQHGGCVGLTDEAQSPDEYYCEQCKPNYHMIIKSLNG